MLCLTKADLNMPVLKRLTDCDANDSNYDLTYLSTRNNRCFHLYLNQRVILTSLLVLSPTTLLSVSPQMTGPEQRPAHRPAAHGPQGGARLLPIYHRSRRREGGLLPHARVCFTAFFITLHKSFSTQRKARKKSA